MKIAKFLGAVSLVTLCLASVCLAGNRSVVTRSELEKTVVAAANHEADGRTTLMNVLRRDSVRRVAAQHGIDMSRVEASAATLHGADLEEAVAQADRVNQALAGGDTITIGATTLIIILLVIIIILVAD
jgi:hypothetical protein